MRPGRAAVHTALPLLGLAALAVLGAVHEAAPSTDPLTYAGHGGASLVPRVIVRVVTDGHPQLVTIPVRRGVLPAAPAPRATRRSATPTPARAASAPRHVGSTAPRPAPFAVPRITTTADAYPYATDTAGGSDAWGFTTRQCVSYVAWQLAAAGRAIDNARQGWGSAFHWDDVARRRGDEVSTKPTVGAVAQWHANEASDYWSAGSTTANGAFVAGAGGHVGWVTKVYEDGSVLVAQYNGTSDRSYSTMRVKAPRYLSL